MSLLQPSLLHEGGIAYLTLALVILPFCLLALFAVVAIERRLLSIAPAHNSDRHTQVQAHMHRHFEGSMRVPLKGRAETKAR